MSRNCRAANTYLGLLYQARNVCWVLTLGAEPMIDGEPSPLSRSILPLSSSASLSLTFCAKLLTVSSEDLLFTKAKDAMAESIQQWTDYISSVPTYQELNDLKERVSRRLPVTKSTTEDQV